MSDFLIKGTIIGLSISKWKNDPTLFSSKLLTVLQNWESENFKPTGELIKSLPKNKSSLFGCIRQTLFALENDIHSLSINYHLLNCIINDSKLDNALKELYLSLLVENYFINIRSVYDQSTHFAKLIMEERNIGKISNDGSLNTLITFCKKDNAKAKQFLTEEIVELLLKSENDLTNIKIVRDGIIHHGREPIVRINNQEVTFRLPAKDIHKGNILPDILNSELENYPLFDYLRIATQRLFDYLENLGDILAFKVHTELEGKYHPLLTSLGGICMREFINFLYLKSQV